jgi:lipopolysaccharide export LptBFGC system permease protein LptF
MNQSHLVIVRFFRCYIFALYKFLLPSIKSNQTTMWKATTTVPKQAIQQKLQQQDDDDDWYVELSQVTKKKKKKKERNTSLFDKIVVSHF